MVIAAMVIVASLSVGVLTVTQSSLSNSLTNIDSTRSRYLAEAGINYAAAQSQENITEIEGKTFKISTNEQFTITEITDIGSQQYTVKSLGTVNEGESNEANYLATTTVTLLSSSSNDIVLHLTTDTGELGDDTGIGHAPIMGEGVTILNSHASNSKGGNGISLDGSLSAHVHYAHHPTLDLTDKGTIMAWIKIDEYQEYAGIIHKGSDGSAYYDSDGTVIFADESYTLQLWQIVTPYGSNKYESTGTVLFAVFGSTSKDDYVELKTSYNFLRNTYYHVAGAWDNTGTKLYINGYLVEDTSNFVVARKTTGDVQIGAQLHNDLYSNTNFPFKGEIWDATIYSRALSQEEIIEYCKNFPATLINDNYFPDYTGETIAVKRQKIRGTYYYYYSK